MTNFFRRFFPLLLCAIALSSCNIFQPIEKRVLSNDDGVRAQALKKIVTLPAEKIQTIIPALVAALHDPDSNIVNRSVDALSTIGRSALDPLRQTLKDPDVYVKVSVISVFGRIGPDAQATIPDLVACLADSHPLVREEAAFSLGQMGQVASSAVSPLLEALKDPNLEVRTASFEALKKIGITPPRFS